MHGLTRGLVAPVVDGYAEILPSFDFETYSEAGYIIHPSGKVESAVEGKKGGLPLVGTPVYAMHPSTEILSLAYDLKDGKGRRLWVPGAPFPTDLLEYIASGGIIEAWNITFEFWIWNAVAVRLYGWPELRLEQCRCAMAKARRFSLPGKLEEALVDALKLQGKDPAGTALIKKLTRPQSTTKERKEHRWYPHTAWPDFQNFYHYNLEDIRAEDSASMRTPDLTPLELAIWQTDQRINLRGVQVDTEALYAAIRILDQTEEKYTRELVHITQGRITSVSEVEKIGDWLAAHGVEAADITKGTVADLLAPGNLLPDNARRVLEIREMLGSANVKKLRTLALRVDQFGRLRDQYTYCGADRTGRWSAGGVQLQNITAKGPAAVVCNTCKTISGVTHGTCPVCLSREVAQVPEWGISCVEQAVKDLKTLDFDTFEKRWPDVIQTLCGCLRGLFTAKPGHDLIACDFSAIEAVVAAALSGCEWRLEVFRTHGKIYEMSVAKIKCKTLQEYEEYKKVNKRHHPDRALGKVAELASGFGGWIAAWIQFGADMPEKEIKDSILAWRAASPEIEHMWGGQYLWCGPGKWDYRPQLFGLEGAAIAAIQHPGQRCSYRDISYIVINDVLLCRLPSGRHLYYHRPRLVPVADKLKRGPSLSITFEGYNSNSQKGPVGWRRQETYGGRLFENVVQGVARDLEAEAMLRVEPAGYPIVMHTHDELCAEVPEGFGSVEEMSALMSTPPAWAKGWPIKAAGWRHKRYQKD